MINHQFTHPAVDSDALPVDERVTFVAQELNGAGNISGFSHPLRRMLHDIPFRVVGNITFVVELTGINSSRRNGIDAGYSRKAYGKRMSQCGNASLGCRIRFGIGLRLKRTS